MKKPKPRNESERWVKNQVNQILTETEWTYWMPNAGVFGRSGVSDFLAIKRPRLFMAIETKYDDVVTVLQFKFLTDVHEAGHFAFLVDETNIETLRTVLTNGVLQPLPRVYGDLLKWKDQNSAEKIDS
jgi:hypothetical protein